MMRRVYYLFVIITLQVRVSSAALFLVQHCDHGIIIATNFSKNILQYLSGDKKIMGAQSMGFCTLLVWRPDFARLCDRTRLFKALTCWTGGFLYNFSEQNSCRSMSGFVGRAPYPGIGSCIVVHSSDSCMVPRTIYHARHIVSAV